MLCELANPELLEYDFWIPFATASFLTAAPKPFCELLYQTEWGPEDPFLIRVVHGPGFACAAQKGFVTSVRCQCQLRGCSSTVHYNQLPQ